MASDAVMLTFTKSKSIPAQKRITGVYTCDRFHVSMCMSFGTETIPKSA